MRSSARIRAVRLRESGYALLMVMFILAVLVLVMAEAAPTVLSSIQREREAEMVWRGKQYTRGVRLYYLKMNRFPTSLDDLTKPKTGIRFMRQAYKDPMNTVDGSWRLIYSGSSEQIMGSAEPQPTPSGEGVSTTRLMASPLSAPTYSAKNPLTLANPAIGSQGAMNNPGGSALSSTNESLSAGSQAMPSSSDAPATSSPLDSSSPFPSRPIIGVASKIDRSSIMRLDGADNYLQFKFIWKVVTANPSTVTPNP